MQKFERVFLPSKGHSLAFLGGDVLVFGILVFLSPADVCRLEVTIPFFLYCANQQVLLIF
jgi:hypothetical protein